LQIKTLGWNYAELCVLLPGIKAMGRLSVLHVRDIKLSVLPAEIKALKQLRDLNLSENDLGKTPRQMTGHPLNLELHFQQ